jgi:hypothetical protein
MLGLQGDREGQAMSEIIIAAKPDPVREAERADLWERFRLLGVKLCCDLRMNLQQDPWGEGQDYDQSQINIWAEQAEKASAELDALLEAAHQFMSRRLPKT